MSDELNVQQTLLAMQQENLAYAQSGFDEWNVHYSTCPSCYCSVSRSMAQRHMTDMRARSDALMQRAAELEMTLEPEVVAMLHSANAHIVGICFREVQARVLKLAQEALHTQAPQPSQPQSFRERLQSWIANGLSETPGTPQGPDTPPEEEPPFKHEREEARVIRF